MSFYCSDENVSGFEETCNNCTLDCRRFWHREGYSKLKTALNCPFPCSRSQDAACHPVKDQMRFLPQCESSLSSSIMMWWWCHDRWGEEAGVMICSSRCHHEPSNNVHIRAMPGGGRSEPGSQGHNSPTLQPVNTLSCHSHPYLSIVFSHFHILPVFDYI